MSTTSKSAVPRLQFHQNAYQFVFDALKRSQQKLGRALAEDPDDESAHISGEELLSGIRDLALEKFGLMTVPVFRRWGIRGTVDFGRIVFELIERGEMRKTDRDQLDDFADVYDFEGVFDRGYHIDTENVFRR